MMVMIMMMIMMIIILVGLVHEIWNIITSMRVPVSSNGLMLLDPTLVPEVRHGGCRIGCCNDSRFDPLQPTGMISVNWLVRRVGAWCVGAEPSIGLRIVRHGEQCVNNQSIRIDCFLFSHIYGLREWAKLTKLCAWPIRRVHPWDLTRNVIETICLGHWI